LALLRLILNSTVLDQKMKRNLFIVLMLLTGFTVKAQEKAIAKVHYLFKHVNDTTQRDKYRRDEVVTYLSPQTSYYTSYSSTRTQEQSAQQMDALNFDGHVIVSKSTSGIRESYLLESSKSNMIEVKRVASDEFLLDAVYPKQDWDIHDDTKVIGGYTCQKATTTFGGRHYTTWFTTDLPFSFGPWKLHGLPGLILEAKDDKSEVEFEYSGFDKLADSVQITIGAPVDVILSAPEEVEKLYRAFKTNPKAYMQTKSGGSSSIKKSGVFVTSDVPFSTIDPNKIKSISIKNDDNYKPSSVTNNPLELKP